jgi:hypothetical protein
MPKVGGRAARRPRLGPRGVLAFRLGIGAIFDLTGATVYRDMRGVLPPAPPDEAGSDPFRAAMGTILASHHDALVSASDDTGANDETGASDDPDARDGVTAPDDAEVRDDAARDKIGVALPG